MTIHFIKMMPACRFHQFSKTKTGDLNPTVTDQKILGIVDTAASICHNILHIRLVSLYNYLQLNTRW